MSKKVLSSTAKEYNDQNSRWKKFVHQNGEHVCGHIIEEIKVASVRWRRKDLEVIKKYSFSLGQRKPEEIVEDQRNYDSPENLPVVLQMMGVERGKPVKS